MCANPSGGQLSQLLANLPGDDLGVVRWPHPEVLSVLDPRPLLDEAAAISEHALGAPGGSLLRPWPPVLLMATGCGSVPPTTSQHDRAASELGIAVHVVTG